jgi:activating signal cointegrator complex subunit 3
VGIHHAGLAEGDRALVEALFVGGRAQVLVCTATLAWGVNFPAHLVVVKGTEFYDARAGRYVDFPVTDVLQMMGRAGRPQFDTRGVAAILVHEPKKQFYRKFLYEPFPVESQLRAALHDHVAAEVCAGTIASRADAADWLTWTFFFRRLLQNPTYYGLDDASDAGVRAYLRAAVDATVADLAASGVVAALPGGGLAPTPLGAIASAYYLRHATAAAFAAAFAGGAAAAPHARSALPALARVLCDAAEFGELPVRHSEDEVNARLSADLPPAWRARAGDALDVLEHPSLLLLLGVDVVRVLGVADGVQVLALEVLVVGGQRGALFEGLFFLEVP